MFLTIIALATLTNIALTVKLGKGAIFSPFVSTLAISASLVYTILILGLVTGKNGLLAWQLISF